MVIAEGWLHAWRDIAVLKPHPRAFRIDVGPVAKSREPGVTIEKTAKDCGVHPMKLTK